MAYKTLPAQREVDVQLNVADWVERMYGAEGTLPESAFAPSVQYQHTITFPVTDPHKISTFFGADRRACILNRMRQLTVRMNECYLHYNKDMHSAYEVFYIPKHSGGRRQIHAPHEDLKRLLRDVADFMQTEMLCLSHDCAYAYVKGRSTKDALVVHQQNNSKWFLKLDMKDFFPNSNPEFIKRKLLNIAPFACMEMHHDAVTNAFLDALMQVATLDNGLPQGTPISPLLTNLAMVAFDYHLNNEARDKQMRYTRYADDILISSAVQFNPIEITRMVERIFQGAPWTINKEKTRFGTSAGRNWNLGLMLNKDNNITLGYKKKERLKAGVNNFLESFTKQEPWDIMEVQQFIGNISYFQSIEPDYCKFVIKRLEEKHGVTFAQVRAWYFDPDN